MLKLLKKIYCSVSSVVKFCNTIEREREKGKDIKPQSS